MQACKAYIIDNQSKWHTMLWWMIRPLLLWNGAADL